MILFRVVQGFTGGVLIPLSFDVILTYLPPSKQPVGMALFTVTATFAPAIGPLIGGWLTDNYGWPFIFYMNAVPGALMIAIVWFTMEDQPMKLSLLKKGDWWGILTMAIGLAAFEIVLEDGNRKDWFGDPGIVNWPGLPRSSFPLSSSLNCTRESRLSTSASLRAETSGLAASSMWSLELAFMAWCSSCPYTWGRCTGTTPPRSERSSSGWAFRNSLSFHSVPKLMQLVDTRIIIGVGILLFGGSCFLNVHLDSNFAGPQFYIPLIIRALGQPLIMVPLSAVTTSGMAKGRESGAASALFNMMRNIGGSIGIAGLSTLLSVRERFHSERIGESVSVYSVAVQERMQQSTAYFLSQGSDSVFSQHARNWRYRWGGPSSVISARLQRLLPGPRLRVARKCGCFVLDEEDESVGACWRALSFLFLKTQLTIQRLAERKSTMATETNSNAAITSNDDSYYEKLASEEEIYLEETEEDVRSLLISGPQDGHPTPALDTAVESYQIPEANQE